MALRLCTRPLRLDSQKQERPHKAGVSGLTSFLLHSIRASATGVIMDPVVDADLRTEV